MCKYIIDYARDELKLNGLYAQPVLHHTITQHMANKNGLTPCYFILNYTSFSSTINNSGERRSLACAIRNFKEEQIKTIYVPKQVMHIIESVYLNACIKRRFSAEQKIESETNCTLSIKESQQLAKIYLSSAGDNWKQQLKQFLLSVKKSNCKVIEMYMNLLSPSIPYAYNIAIDFDFFCTGVLPLSTEGDFLMMQCTLSDVVEYDKLCTIEPYSSMLSQIKLLDPNEQ